jgi:hypothetical protein
MSGVYGTFATIVTLTHLFHNSSMPNRTMYAATNSILIVPSSHHIHNATKKPYSFQQNLIPTNKT